ncbi:hypothetical protein BIY24_07810 [Halobacteriovorax marinus]|uniref:hypothetical protein n=1 Tax=Halobacteriovorax marinus TaxID=97084 RepID=UPI000BC33476|nr:hypothetical protein [Halobacteriovorax marinus]ATH07858.1 hypothetical protein BIY24_07810 [Halobacteriovorax marinus]
MKFLFISFFITLFLATKTYALDTEVKGFIALNTLSYESVEDRDPTMKMGIGTIDLKFYFNHEDFGAKIKLDLDGQLDEPNNLYEEAMLTWRPMRNWRFGIGKGKVRIHQMAFGVLESHYIDGGSLLGTKHSFRDQDRKIVGEISYGGYRKGFRNTFNVYADSRQPKEDYDTSNPVGYETDDSSNPGRGEIIYETEKEIDTRKDIGIANKIYFYPKRGVEFAIGGLIKDRDLDYNLNWATDVSGKYKTGAWEFIFEYTFAYVSNHPNDRYAIEHQYEQLGQLQVLYELTEITTLQLNTEFALVNSQEFNKNNIPNGVGQQNFNRGQSAHTNNYKVDFGVIWKMAKRVNFKVGALYERKYEWKALSHLGYAHGYAGFRDAWALGSGVNFWF